MGVLNLAAYFSKIYYDGLLTEILRTGIKQKYTIN